MSFKLTNLAKTPFPARQNQAFHTDRYSQITIHENSLILPPTFKICLLAHALINGVNIVVFFSYLEHTRRLANIYPICMFDQKFGGVSCPRLINTRNSYLDGLDLTQIPTTMMVRAKLVLTETTWSYFVNRSTKNQHQCLERMATGEITIQNTWTKQSFWA